MKIYAKTMSGMIPNSWLLLNFDEQWINKLIAICILLFFPIVPLVLFLLVYIINV